MSSSQIHARAVEVARKYRACEVELIEVLQEVDRHRVFTSQGYNSLFKYVTEGLKLSDEVAYIYIGVARKALEVPALKEEIRLGRITVTKARRVASVIDSSNQNHWLELARSSSKQKLEKEISLVKPSEAVRDQLKFSAAPVEHVKLKQDIARVQLQVGISEDLMLQIRHAQDLLSQKRQRNVGLEEVLAVLVESYVRKEDPVEKAKRSKIKSQAGVTHTQIAKNLGMDNSAEVQLKKEEKAATSSQEIATQTLKQLCPGTVRRPFAARTKHEVNLKFGGRCSYENSGRRCNQRRFLHIHHKIPVAVGGTNEVSNLELLCSGHHKIRHMEDHGHN